jgi:hypothetical protein
MLLRSLLSLPIVCLAIGTLWAANDPFVGKWKVNPSKSKLTDEVKVEAVGENKYAITFSPDAVDTIVADGTDQPALSGTTLSITVKRTQQLGDHPQDEGPHAPQRVLGAFRRWQNVERRLYAIFARRYDIVLATFARRFDIVLALCVRADGGKFRFSWHMGQRERESEDGDRTPDPALRDDGLLFKRSDEEMVKRIKLDGKDYPELDPKGG